MRSQSYQDASEEDKIHFMDCRVCGEKLDCRDLDEVFQHEDHAPHPDIPYKGSVRMPDSLPNQAMPKNSEPSVQPKSEASPNKSPNGSSEAAHKWEWHATGAGMGWNCWKCDTHHSFTTDEDTPPEYGCPETGSPFWQNVEQSGGEAVPNPKQPNQ